MTEHLTRPGVQPVSVGGVVFGRGDVPVIAGPCSVEHGYVEHAHAAAGAGADVLRGCVFKPRSGPDRFQGMGAEAIPLLDQAHAETGLPIIAEPLDAADVELLYTHVQGFLVGTRSMHNSRLLQAIGQTGMPVIVKRAFSATYDEWLGAASYVRAEGNDNVILCERGIRTFIAETRNTLDISAIPVIQEMTDLPVIVDPSHAAGRSEWVTPLALAAVAAGADGLIVECHPVPAESWTDSRQALAPQTLARLISQARDQRRLSQALTGYAEADEHLQIRSIDEAIRLLQERRAEATRRIELRQRTVEMAGDI